MKIELKIIKVRDIAQKYRDDAEEGVTGYNFVRVKRKQRSYHVG